MIDDDRLSRQIQFLLEIDKLKAVLRQTWLIDQSRRENDAEHSWHLAVMAVVLAEHAEADGLDLRRVIEMLLVHDLVEIDAGDTFAYDTKGNQDKQQRETKAADRIFNIPPPEQADRLRALWEEFERRQTPEARYAAALDRLQPLMHNYYTEGRAWRAHGVTREQVVARNRHIVEGAPALWELARAMIDDAVAKGHLAE